MTASHSPHAASSSRLPKVSAAGGAPIAARTAASSAGSRTTTAVQRAWSPADPATSARAGCFPASPVPHNPTRSKLLVLFDERARAVVAGLPRLGHEGRDL